MFANARDTRTACRTQIGDPIGANVAWEVRRVTMILPSLLDGMPEIRAALTADARGTLKSATSPDRADRLAFWLWVLFAYLVTLVVEMWLLAGGHRGPDARGPGTRWPNEPPG